MPLTPLPRLLACLVSAGLTVQAHNIDTNQVSDTSLSAIIVPDEAEIGSTTQVWLGALYGGQWFLRNANGGWQAFEGSYPVAIPSLTLGPVNAINISQGLDLSSLPGLEVYLGYGNSVAAFNNTPGHLRKVHMVTPAGSAGLSAAVDVTRLPMGDGKTSSSPTRGSIWACTTTGGGGGASQAGPWIRGDGTYDLTAKLSVIGSVPWSGNFSAVVSGSSRIISGNGLPGHTTGSYPIASSDPAYQYDRNPNSIKGQTVSLTLPALPQLAASSSCLPGGAIGILTSGVVIFNGLDAENRDAVAHEVQDRCQGHPERNGSYHYHNISTCIAEKAEPAEHSPLVGYAYDGFGIYGRYGEGGKLLTNADLDECHGHTHTLDWDGQQRSLYHYHATWEYPYTLGCFRGNRVR